LPVPTALPIPERGKDDSLVLVRGSNLYHFLGGTRSMRSTRLRKMMTTGFVEANPADAHELGLSEGDTVQVCNSQATVTMTLRLSASLLRGMLFCPYFDASASALSSLSLDITDVEFRRVWIKKESEYGKS
jgi:formate dehydrogenase (coenzyme F420) alpha subunit